MPSSSPPCHADTSSHFPHQAVIFFAGLLYPVRYPTPPLTGSTPHFISAIITPPYQTEYHLSMDLGTRHNWLRSLLCQRLLSCCGCLALGAVLIHQYTGNLDGTNASKEEVDCGETGKRLASARMWYGRERTYRMFLGLMIKHQRVQIAPVQVRAAFWVRERDSAGRVKSETPARTRAHWFELAVCIKDTGIE